MSVRNAQSEYVDQGLVSVPDVVDTPTIGTAIDVGTSRAYNNGAATVTFTPATTGGAASTYTATSTPGSFTGSGTSSPVTVAGLSSATAYTFTVQGVNSSGTWAASSASNSITATTIPQAPTIGTASVTNATTVSVPFTAGATGGKSITSYTTTSSPSISLSTSGTTTPLTVTGTFVANQAYTFTIAAVNDNGTSAASSASNSITPLSTAFDSIATATGTGSSGTITFSSIPSTYQHLQIRCIVRNTSSSTASNLQLNNDTGSNYTRHEIQGTGSAVSASGSISQTSMLCFRPAVSTQTADCVGVAIIDIHDYASTSKYKTIRSFFGVDTNSGSTTDRLLLTSGLWLSTSAISTITLSLAASNNFTTSSTFALYGIKGA
jgi:hypothetical protein